MTYEQSVTILKMFYMRIYPTCFYPWPLFSLAALMSCTSVCTPERNILQVLSTLDSFTFPNLKKMHWFCTRDDRQGLRTAGYGPSQLTTGSLSLSCRSCREMRIWITSEVTSVMIRIRMKLRINSNQSWNGNDFTPKNTVWSI
jgi:hypothetical protein